MGWNAVYAAVAVLAAAGGAYQSEKQAGKAADAQEKARKKQDALNAEQAAKEKRQQIREERIKRAKIIQGAVNTGTAGSAGELGNLSGLNTQFGENLGFNAEMLAGAKAISNLNQASSDFMRKAQQAQNYGNAISSMASAAASYKTPAATTPNTADLAGIDNSIFGPPTYLKNPQG